ncbi:erythromycin esterase family protein [Salsuginibacillus kocurii]|uniref:erythromycin esterase family protein n=1 Tax=Salsuginibacillus kocurii TaxID=427078 RepID=UPI00036EB38D|nr:erythromycin esterase family protein [Salsuginibacillus kocurii]
MNKPLFLYLLVVMLMVLSACIGEDEAEEPDSEAPESEVLEAVDHAEEENEESVPVSSYNADEQVEVIDSLFFGSDQREFSFLDDLVSDKSVVFLGEQMEGTREYTALFSRVIRHLHEEHGFDVVLFPYSYGDLQTQQLQGEHPHLFAADPTINFWPGEEMVTLLEYMEEEGNELQAGGFTPLMSEREPESVQQLIDKNELEIELEEADDTLRAWQTSWREATTAESRTITHETAVEEGDDLKRIYKDAAAAVAEAREEDDGEELASLDRLLDGRLALVDTLQSEHETKENSRYSDAWDEVMAANIEWLVEEVYEDEKVIVWGDNRMFRKRSNSAVEESGDPDWFSNIWLQLDDAIQAESYVIGTYTQAGEYNALPQGGIAGVEEPLSGSLESRLGENGYSHSFLDLSELEDTIYHEVLTAHERGSEPLHFVPAEQYDGLFFIDEVRPAASASEALAPASIGRAVSQ